MRFTVDVRFALSYTAAMAVLLISYLLVTLSVPLVQQDIRSLALLLVAAVALSGVAVLFRRNKALVMDQRRARAREDRNRTALWESARYHRILVETAPYGFMLADPTGRIFKANQQAATLHGFETPEAMLETNVFDLIAPNDRRCAREALERQGERGDGKSLHEEYSLVKRDGTTFPGEVSATVLWDDKQEGSAFTIVTRDISERKRFEAQLQHRAFHDPLTDLPNRALLHDRIQQAILAAHRGAAPIALLLMDLDRFKEINDTFGHHYGDLLLQQVGIRLQRVVRESDTVARLGGDEFAILLPGTDRRGAIQTAQKIVNTLDQPFRQDGQSFEVEGSVGIAVYPEHGEDATALLQRADVAMYVAKREDIGYSLYTPEVDQYSPDRLALIGDLRPAIEEDQLLLHYQPKVDLKTGQVEGVEALVRWKHPLRGFIPPDQFIPLAEHTGLIKPLTFWVLEHALRQCRRWKDAGLEIGVAVNLSARVLHDPQLVTTMGALLDATGVEPAALEVELTESAFMTDPPRAREVLTRVHDMGVGIGVDDFGAGHSSLAYLKQLPVDHVKIDRSFVRDMATDEKDYRIVRAAINLGHAIGLKVVAEGVEDQQMLDLLSSLGCDLAQGYYLSRPLPAQECTWWLSGRTYSAAS